MMAARTLPRMRAMGHDDDIVGAIAACRDAGEPSRELDAHIALAVFPALGALPSLTPGIWMKEDGVHVRALLYSSTYRAAATLVPPGYWIEDAAAGPVVVGELGEWGTFHPVKAIALCIAALYARKAELSCAH